LLGDGVELDPLKRMVIERTEGNPFFIEEMVQALFDESALVRNGAVRVTRPLSQLRLPPTVQGILAARIDRLSVEQKELLQTLAVMGRESPMGLIRQVSSTGEAQLERTLSALQAGEFIYEQSAAAGIEYTFKHALTQEVTYNSLLIERRKLLHEQAGDAIETLFAAENIADHLERLAYHYSHSANIDKALTYLQRAGEVAVERSADMAAAAHFTAALELLQTLPDSDGRAERELELRIKLGPLMPNVGRWDEAEKLYLRARELCQRLGEGPLLFPVLWGLWYFHHWRAEFTVARDLAEQMLALAERLNDPALIAQAHHSLWATLEFEGELVSALHHTEQGIALAPKLHVSQALRYGGHDLGVCARYIAGYALLRLGYPQQALQKTQEAVTMAREIAHFGTLALALVYASGEQLECGKTETAGELADALVRVSEEHSIEWSIVAGRFMQSWVQVERSQGKDGIARMRHAFDQIARIKAMHDNLVGSMAECLGRAGQAEDGLKLVDEALATAGYRCGEADWYRIKGDLLLLRDGANAAEAEKCFHNAIDIARAQHAKLFELRATNSLARLLAQHGRRDEARTMLAEIYGWFTEGFDTADLIDAKALLDELSA
jgi:adenylate cyclase